MNKQKKLKIIISESQFRRLTDNYDVKEAIHESIPKKIKLVKLSKAKTSPKKRRFFIQIIVKLLLHPVTIPN